MLESRIVWLTIIFLDTETENNLFFEILKMDWNFGVKQPIYIIWLLTTQELFYNMFFFKSNEVTVFCLGLPIVKERGR